MLGDSYNLCIYPLVVEEYHPDNFLFLVLSVLGEGELKRRIRTLFNIINSILSSFFRWNFNLSALEIDEIGCVSVEC